MRIVYFGTPEFAVPGLRALVAAGHDIPLVVTQPDRPSGRGYRITPSPVKTAALELGLPVEQPERVAVGGFPDLLRQLAPEACVVVAFGQKIPADLLSLPPGGWVNLHASLLPRWRGAAPVARAIMAGDRTSGVTTMYLDLGWDTGDMILRREVPVGPDENAGELLARLGSIGARVLAETMALIGTGKAPRQPQDAAQAILAPRLSPDEGEVDWAMSAAEIHNRVRGLSPAPGAYSFSQGRRLKLIRTSLSGHGAAACAEASGSDVPGTLLLLGKEVWVACGTGHVRLVEVQGEGGRPLPAETFARGQRWESGHRLGGKG